MSEDQPGPDLPLPAPVRGAEIGSFAYNSVVTRLPNIARIILAENHYPPEITDKIEALIQEIPATSIRALEDLSAPDAADWDSYLIPYHGQDWLQIPWFFAEAYFYRRILEATGYFLDGPGKGLDPYTFQKRSGLETSRLAIRTLTAFCNDYLRERPMADRDWKRQGFRRFLTSALWGNQSDLSMWPIGHANQPAHIEHTHQEAHLLVDDRGPVSETLLDLNRRPERVDILVDNAGFELVCDLCLADFLLSSQMVSSIHLHVKAHPTYVSDATPADVDHTLAFLAGDSDREAATLGGRLQGYLDQGRLAIREHLFWTSPLPMWEIPSGLRQDLAGSQLVISKGDANYRRLLGDLHWPFLTPFSAILNYFPAPLVALRTLKSELMAGLPAGRPEELSRQDPNWLIDGRWGVIQSSLKKVSA